MATDNELKELCRDCDGTGTRDVHENHLKVSVLSECCVTCNGTGWVYAPDAEALEEGPDAQWKSVTSTTAQALESELDTCWNAQRGDRFLVDSTVPQARLVALHDAVATTVPGDSPEDVVRRAQAYLDFLKGGAE